jgi:probable HAF family extracellular repeat protein
MGSQVNYPTNIAAAVRPACYSKAIRRLAGCGTVLAAVVLLGVPSPAFAGYRITMVAPGPGNDGAAVNALGDVATGSTDQSVAPGFGILWTDGTTIPLETTPPTCAPSSAEPADLNNHRLVVGRLFQCFTPDLPAVWRSDGTLHLLPRLASSPGGAAYAVNDDGEIGGCDFSVDMQHCVPFSYYKGVLHRLALPTSYTDGVPTHTAALHDFVGWASGLGNTSLAARWRYGVFHVLGKLRGDDGSSATGSTASGDAVGWSYRLVDSSYERDRAVVFAQGRVVALPRLSRHETGSLALAINRRGAIVGESSDSTAGTRHAVLWRRGVVTDLNRLIPKNAGWLLYQARDINNAGQIICSGHRASDNTDWTLLLTPTT